MTTTLAISQPDREAAVRGIVDHACRRGFAIAVHLLGNRADAEDAVQDAVASALRDVDRLRDLDTVEGWFYRVLVNTCMRMLRRRRLADGFRRLLGMGGEPVVEASAGAPDHTRILVEIARLPAMQRAAIVLRHGQGLGVDETARMLGVGEETVKTHLKRALARLRARLGDDHV